MPFAERVPSSHRDLQKKSSIALLHLTFWPSSSDLTFFHLGKKQQLHRPQSPATFPFTRKFTIQRMKILASPKNLRFSGGWLEGHAFRVDHHLLGRVQLCTLCRLSDWKKEFKGVRYVANQTNAPCFGEILEIYINLPCVCIVWFPQNGVIWWHLTKHKDMAKTESWLVEVWFNKNSLLQMGQLLTTWFTAQLRENTKIILSLVECNLGCSGIPVASTRSQYWILY